MEPGVAAAAYTAETVLEGAVGAGVAVAKPTMPLKAAWQPIVSSVLLPRSSHSLSLVKGKLYIFGGEIEPRKPVDNDMHVFTLPSSGDDAVDYNTVPARGAKGEESVPPPRVGHTAAVIGESIYIFGGRGGKDMQPLAEKGRVWVFNTKFSHWSHFDPVDSTPYPEPRSYHASVATEHPIASSSDYTESPFGASDLDTYGTLFIHAGCPASGRSSDMWAFDVASHTWAQYPDAPGPARGGPSLAFTQNRLYRFGGFDGENELGVQIDYLDILVSTFDDKGGKGEMCVSPRTGKWEFLEFPAEGTSPGNRSVAGLQPITTGQGRNYLLLFLGERDPSSSGHEGAGKFWDDVWSFQLRPDGMTAASFKDAIRMTVGAKTAEGTWAPVDIPESTKSKSRQAHPGPRGWFASSGGQDLGPSNIILWGGVKPDNERAGDGWILTVE